MDDKIRRLLKKYDIAENKSIAEIIESIELRQEDLQERNNNAKDSTYRDQLDELADVLDYFDELQKTEGSYLTEFEDEKEKTEPSKKNIDFSDIKGNKPATAPTSTRSMVQGGAANTTAGMNNGAGVNSGAGSSGAVATGTGMPGTAGPSSPAPKKKPSTPEEWFFESVTGNPAVDNLFVRILDDIKYEQWNNVARMAESIKPLEPRNPGVFIARLMAARHLKKIEDMQLDVTANYADDIDYKRAMEYSSEAQRKYLSDLLEAKVKMGGYVDAERAYGNACASNRSGDYIRAADLFEALGDYKDAKDRAQKSRDAAYKLVVSDHISEQTNKIEENLRKEIESDQLIFELDEYCRHEPLAANYITKDKIEEYSRLNKNVQKTITSRKRTISFANKFYLGVIILLIVWRAFPLIDDINVEWRSGELVVNNYLPVPATSNYLWIDDNYKFPWILIKNPFTKVISLSGAAADKPLIYFYNNLEEFQISNCNEDAISTPKGTEYLSYSACNGLTNLVIPKGTEVVDVSECGELTELIVPIGTSRVYVSECNALTVLSIQEGTSKVSVNNCSELRKLIIPDGTKEIDINSCVNLEELIIPESVTKVSIWGCPKLPD